MSLLKELQNYIISDLIMIIELKFGCVEYDILYIMFIQYQTELDKCLGIQLG